MAKSKAKAKGKIQPLYDNILVSYMETEMTEGGIYVPTSSQHNENRTCGKVIAAGPDCKKVKVGDTVMFGVYAGLKIIPQDMILFGAESPVKDETWKILKELDVIATIG